jgi:hypothetical protein
MATDRLPRDRQRGNSLVLALIVMSALATLGSLTVVSVQSSLKTSTNDRSQTIALYAAESGAAYAMDFLRANSPHPPPSPPSPPPLPTDWNRYVHGNIPEAPDPLFPTNRALPGVTGNSFSPDQNAWFDIKFINNHTDPRYNDDPTIDTETDWQITIQSTGHGPLGSVAIVEWEVKLDLDPAHSNSLILVGWHVVDL